ncbi:helix-turn-helix domain-containing protein [Enterococcus sp. BWB1-3]|uniref:helix-turn-helix domain-containing protein n=1 Tax=Enterococcus sp. BWB1-3 TaxID=2787713 RepID=UPI002ED005EA
MITIGSQIKKYRIKLHMSQSQLAHGICSQAQLSRIENSNQTPSVHIVKLFSERLNISLNTLLSFNSDYISEQKKNIKKLENCVLMEEYGEIEHILANFNFEDSSLEKINYQKILYFKGLFLNKIQKKYLASIQQLIDALEQTMDTKYKKMGF